MKKILWLLLVQLMFWGIKAQNIVYEGNIYETSENNKTPLFGANVFTKDGTFGTTSDENGYFKLTIPKTYKKVVVSYIGFQEKEVLLNDGTSKLSINLDADVLEEVTFTYKKLDRSTIDPYNSQVIDAKELTKAACCNLSESFETNVSIDVGASDAISGAKRLRMLGLDSYYTQTMNENQPGIRGLSNTFGMLFVPGPFMTSIAINKGAGSVTNGYEAITGQINYNYKQPDDSERFYLNVFGSRHGQFELNTNVSHRFNDKLSSIVLVHGTIHEFKHDDNNDGFQEMPLNERVVVANKWMYNSKKAFESQFGFDYTYDERNGGQLPTLKLNEGRTDLFQTMNINRRYNVY